VLDLAPQMQHVPVQAVEHPHWTIREAMQLLQVKPVTVKVADDGSATFCTEVTGQEFGGLDHCLLSNYLISCPPVTLIA
jgi:hypothetical protein